MIDTIDFTPIGVIRTPHGELENMPIPPAGARGVRGTVEIEPRFTDGLRDLDGFSHVILLYHFHASRKADLVVTPFLDTEPRGVFATRAPNRPNPIGLSVVKLVGVDGHVLTVEDVDMLDGTPLLDLKPYIPEFDGVEDVHLGWLAEVRGRSRNARADDRFK